jgi:hypothetical protein
MKILSILSAVLFSTAFLGVSAAAYADRAHRVQERRMEHQMERHMDRKHDLPTPAYQVHRHVNQLIKHGTNTADQLGGMGYQGLNDGAQDVGEVVR